MNESHARRSLALLGLGLVVALSLSVLSVPTDPLIHVASDDPSREQTRSQTLTLKLAQGPGSAALHTFNAYAPGLAQVRVSWEGDADELEVAVHGRRRPGLSNPAAAYASIRGSSPLSLVCPLRGLDIARGGAWRLIIRDATGQGRAAALKVELCVPHDASSESELQRYREELASGTIVLTKQADASFRAAHAASPPEGTLTLVKLKRAPRLGEGRLLEKRGLHCGGRFPGGAYQVFVEQGADLDDPIVSGVVDRYFALEPEEKLAPSLLAEDPAGPLELVVVFRDDVPLAEAEAILSVFSSRRRHLGFASWSITGSRDTLLDLAESPAVAWIEPASPPLAKLNDNTRNLTRVDLVRSMTGRTGAGVSIYIHEHPTFDPNHPDLAHEDGPMFVPGISTVDAHATLVASAAGGTGVQSPAGLDLSGMAPDATLVRTGNLPASPFPPPPAPFLTQIIDATEESLFFFNYGVDVVNHSHQHTLNNAYSARSRVLDGLIADSSIGQPWLAHVFAAGNEALGNSNPANSQTSTGFFSLVVQSKNAIVVGNWDSYEHGLHYSSSLGPTVDGRIKPDVVAPGAHIMAATTRTSPMDPWGYETVTGTSFAAPAVSGICALMLDAWHATYNAPNSPVLSQSRPLPSTLRAALIQTANDQESLDIRHENTHPGRSLVDLTVPARATEGPDPTTGYGPVDALEAVLLIEDGPDAQGRPRRIFEGQVWHGLVFRWDLANVAGPEVKTTLAWDDPPPPANQSDIAPKLVEDLDLRLIDPSGGVHYPWVINQTHVAPTNTYRGTFHGNGGGEEILPATIFNQNNAWTPTRKPDHLNNVEQVTADVGQLTGTWTVEVSGQRVNAMDSDPQSYSLVSSLPLTNGKVWCALLPTDPLTPPRWLQFTNSYDILDAFDQPVSWNVLGSGVVVRTHFDDLHWDGSRTENHWPANSPLVGQLFPDAAGDDPSWVGLTLEGMQVDVPFGSTASPITTVNLPELAVGFDGSGDLSMGALLSVNTPVSTTVGGFQVGLDSFDVAVGVRPSAHANAGDPFAALTSVNGTITFPTQLVAGPNGEPISLPFDVSEVVPNNGNVMLCVTTDQELAVRLADAGVWLRIPTGTTLAIDLDETDNPWLTGCAGATAPANLGAAAANDPAWRGVYIQSCTAMIPMGGECLEVAFTDVAIGELNGSFSLAGQAMTGTVPPAGPLDVLGVGVQFNSITVDFGYDALAGRVRVAIDIGSGSVTLPPDLAQDANSPGNPVTITFNGPGPRDVDEDGLLLCFTPSSGLLIDVLGTGVQLNVGTNQVFALDLHTGLNPWSPDPDNSNNPVCPGAQAPAGLAGAVPSWKGVYFSQLNVILPLEEGNSFTFSAQHLAVGTGGLSGRLSDTTPRTLLLNDFTVTITTALLEFTNSALTRVDVSGEMTLPYFDELLALSLVYGQGGVWRIDVQTAAGIPLRFPPGTGPQSPPLEFILRRLAFGREATGGFVALDGTLNVNSEMVFSAEFNDLRIDEDGRVTLAGGRLNLPQPIAVEISGGFAFELRALGLSSDENANRFISLYGDFDFPDILPVRPAGEEVKIFLEGPTGGLPSFPGIEIDTKLPGIGHIRGAVFKQPLEFRGELEVTIDALGVTVMAELVVARDGPNGFSYWYVDLDVQLPYGIPLSPIPLSIYGFAGAFGKNVAIQFNDSFPRGVFDPPVMPAQGALTMMLGLTLGTSDDGYTFNADVRFLLTLPGPSIALTGDGWVVTKRSQRSDPAPFQAAIIYGNSIFSAALTGGLSVNNNDNLIRLQGSMELYFSPSEWHLYFGRKEPAHRLRATALTIGGAEAYFMIGNRVPFASGPGPGLLTGASIGFGGSWKKLGFGITAEAHIGGEMEISAEPLQVGVVAELGGRVELCLFGVCIGISLDAQIVGRAPDPFGMGACGRGCIKLLFSKKCVDFRFEFGNPGTSVNVTAPDPIASFGFRREGSDDQVVLSSTPTARVPIDRPIGYVTFQEPMDASHAGSPNRYTGQQLAATVADLGRTVVPPPSPPTDGSACELPPTQTTVVHRLIAFDLQRNSNPLPWLEHGWGPAQGMDITAFETAALALAEPQRSERIAERFRRYTFAPTGREELWDPCPFTCLSQQQALAALEPPAGLCDPALFRYGALRVDCDRDYFVDATTTGLSPAGPSTLNLSDGVLRHVYTRGPECLPIGVSDAPSAIVRLDDGKLLVPFRALTGGSPPVGCTGAPGPNPILFWIATDNGVVDCGDAQAGVQNYRREWRPFMPDTPYTLELTAEAHHTIQIINQTFTTAELPEDLGDHVAWTSPAAGAQAIYPGHQIRVQLDEPWLLTLFDQPGSPVRRPLRLRVHDDQGVVLSPLNGSGPLITELSDPHDDDPDHLVLVETGAGPPVLQPGARYTVEVLAVDPTTNLPSGPARHTFDFQVSDYPDMRHLLLAPEQSTEWQPEPPSGGGTTLLVNFGHDVDWALVEAVYLSNLNADTDAGIALGHLPLAAVENCGGPPHSYRFPRPSGVPGAVQAGIANPDGSEGRIALRPYATSHASAGSPEVLTFTTAEPLDWLHVRASIVGAPALTVTRESPDDASAHVLRLSGAPPPSARLRLLRDGDSGAGPIITSASGPVCELADLTIVVN